MIGIALEDRFEHLPGAVEVEVGFSATVEESDGEVDLGVDEIRVEAQGFFKGPDGPVVIVLLHEGDAAVHGLDDLRRIRGRFAGSAGGEEDEQGDDGGAAAAADQFTEEGDGHETMD